VATSATTDRILAPARPRSLVSDYATLFKIRVSTMVIITAGAGYYLGSLQSGISPFHAGMIQALFGIAVVTCGSSALNQALERKTDRMMHRTADRPMAAGRMSLTHGLVLGFAATFLGSLFLAYNTNPLTGTLTLLTAIGYVAIYTPLKRFTTLNTFIGAFPGALPPLIGWTAARGVIEWPGIALFTILFLWQFPHFMAIGWMYREDYARGGIRLTATNPDTRHAAQSSAIQAVFYAILMIPASLWLSYLRVTGLPYTIVATLLGLWYLYASIRFARIARSANEPENRASARNLLKVSVIYLPLLMLAMILNAQGRLLF
jgi:protoheme IX farnesyltransferase